MGPDEQRAGATRQDEAQALAENRRIDAEAQRRRVLPAKIEFDHGNQLAVVAGRADRQMYFYIAEPGLPRQLARQLDPDRHMPSIPDAIGTAHKSVASHHHKSPIRFRAS
ncbi:hypothetical protein GCM10011367_21030 [Marinicauda pacifica]|nr:hypothetical protein GCM10011367_21030 [Marinicauda pacifica]